MACNHQGPEHTARTPMQTPVSAVEEPLQPAMYMPLPQSVVLQPARLGVSPRRAQC